MTNLYFGGAEVGSWRTVLSAQKVTHVSLSYMGLRRRTKFTRPWLISDHFTDPSQSIFLDSGAYTVNQDTEGDKYSQGDLKDISAQYMAFVEANADDIHLVSEFDSLALGLEWVRAMRKDFYSLLDEDKFLPVWHAQWGIDELERLCSTYPRVGVTQVSLGERNLVPNLNAYVRRYGTKLHGIAMTKPDLIESVSWDSVASTSWISPTQFGDTIIWTGRELKRYPKKMKDQARKRHRTYLEQNGFDAAAIAADDSAELIRLSIWSWQQYMASGLRGHASTPEVVTTSVEEAEEGFAETGPSLVDTSPSEIRKAVATPVKRRETSVLPVMGVQTLMEKDERSGEDKPQQVVTIRSESQRACDSCFLSAKCPMFEPGANCAYSIPVTVKTPSQMRALQDGLVEMQAQRVLFARMVEEIEGGYPDANLSGEIDRLQKLIKVKTELEQDSFSFKVEAKGRNGAGGAGMLSRLFGAEAGEKASAFPTPINADDYIESTVLK